MDDDLHGLLAAENVAHVRLLALKALVYAEEVTDLAGHMGGQLGDVGIEVVGRILKGDGDDLLVLRAAVLHADDTDGEAAHKAQRADALAAQYQHVQRVTVLGPRAGDEAVVRGVVRGGIEDAVQTQHARLLVELVLVLRALLDLDHGPEVLRLYAGGGDIMPDIHVVFLLLFCFPVFVHLFCSSNIITRLRPGFVRGRSRRAAAARRRTGG